MLVATQTTVQTAEAAVVQALLVQTQHLLLAQTAVREHLIL
jgi:hypothetical protein